MHHSAVRQSPLVIHEVAGSSMLAFGLVSLLGTVAAMLWHRHFVFDLLSPVIMLLGFRIRDGSRTAAKWALAVTGLYLVGGCFMALAGIFDWGVTINDQPLPRHQMPWWLTAMVVVGGWQAANFVLIVKWLRGSAPATRSRVEPRC